MTRSCPKMEPGREGAVRASGRCPSRVLRCLVGEKLLGVAAGVEKQEGESERAETDRGREGEGERERERARGREGERATGRELDGQTSGSRGGWVCIAPGPNGGGGRDKGNRPGTRAWLGLGTLSQRQERAAHDLGLPGCGSVFRVWGGADGRG